MSCPDVVSRVICSCLDSAQENIDGAPLSDAETENGYSGIPADIMQTDISRLTDEQKQLLRERAATNSTAARLCQARGKRAGGRGKEAGGQDPGAEALGRRRGRAAGPGGRGRGWKPGPRAWAAGIGARAPGPLPLESGPDLCAGARALGPEAQPPPGLGPRPGGAGFQVPAAPAVRALARSAGRRHSWYLEAVCLEALRSTEPEARAGAGDGARGGRSPSPGPWAPGSADWGPGLTLVAGPIDPLWAF